MHHQRSNIRQSNNAEAVALLRKHTIMLTGTREEMLYMHKLITRRCAESGLPFNIEQALWILPLFNQMNGSSYIESTFKGTGSVMSLTLLENNTIAVRLTNK